MRALVLLVKSLVWAACIALDQSFKMFSRRHAGPAVLESSSSSDACAVDAIQDSISDLPIVQSKEWMERREKSGRVFGSMQAVGSVPRVALPRHTPNPSSRDSRTDVV